MRIFIPALFFILLAVPILTVSSTGDDYSNTIQRVEVTNFPKEQEVRGNVSVTGRLSHSEIVRRQGIIVPPVKRSDTTNLLQGGSIETDGFTSLIVSLQGELQSSSFVPGTIGVILIPDEAPVMRAFTDDQKILFPFETTGEAEPATFPYFTSKSEQLTIGFPSYRVFIYNTTGTTAELNLYVYLTH